MQFTPWTLAAAALAVLAALAPLQKGGTKDKKGGERERKPVAAAPARLTPWLGNLEDARKRARARNVPVLVHIVLEGEPSNDEYREKVLPDAELLKASAGAIVIVANNGTHKRKQVEDVVDGEKVQREVCAVYPAFATCAQHQAAWDDLYREFNDNGELKCPQTVVLLPDGSVSGRINTGGVPATAEVIALIAEAQAKAGPGLTEAQLADVQHNLEEGRRLTAAKTWPQAWRAWAAVLAITQKSAYAEEAQREQAKALAGIAADVERLAAGLAPGTAAKAFEELTKYAVEIAGTPAEKDAQLRLRKAENDKAIAAEIKAWRLSQEADALLREARELTDGGEAKKAEKVVRKLLGKKYAGTPAQETARKLWPDVTVD